MQKLHWLLVVAASLPAAALAQDPKSTQKPATERAASVATPRNHPTIIASIAIGQPAPDFGLEDASGRPVRLSSLRGDWTVLLFTDRARQLIPYSAIDPELRTLGGRIVGVSHEKVQTLRSIGARESIPFVMLADATGEVSTMYGLYQRDRGETRPGFMVLDREGTVRLALLGHLPEPHEVERYARFVITGL